MTADESRALTPKGIEAHAVTSWFEEHVAAAQPPLRFQPIVGGHSNLTYRVVDAAGQTYVLRRPPLGAVLKTAHDMAREHRILVGINQTEVPVPGLLGLCEDESVNGAPFYVMEFVAGHVLDNVERAEEAIPQPESRHKLGLATADVLADLHLVDPDAIGLGKLGRKEAYLDRQLKRWRRQWNDSKTRELAAMEDAYALLLEAKPEQLYTGIVHGDYRLGNMLSREDGTVRAVLDWELCTLGDVLADLGYLLNNWVEPDEADEPRSAAPPSAAAGFPSRAEWLERYSAKTGYDTSGVAYYQAFQHWRLAAICEGVMARYIKGVMVNEGFDTDGYKSRIDDMANAALRLVSSL